MGHRGYNTPQTSHRGSTYRVGDNFDITNMNISVPLEDTPNQQISKVVRITAKKENYYGGNHTQSRIFQTSDRHARILGSKPFQLDQMHGKSVRNRHPKDNLQRVSEVGRAGAPIHRATRCDYYTQYSGNNGITEKNY